MAHHSPLQTQKFLSLLVVLVLVFSPIQSASAENITQNALSATTDPVPVLLKDIYTADASSDPYDFFAYGDLFFYRGYDSAHGSELWVSNGAAGGTNMVADITPGPDSSVPLNFTVFRDKLFFSIAPYASGTSRGLWFTDGVPGHVTNVFNSPWECEYGQVDYLVPLGDWLYFTCGQRLLRYGGPQNQVENNLPKFSIGYSGIIQMNGALYLSANNGVLGDELWRYDPSISATQLTWVKDICQGYCTYNNISSTPRQFMLAENKLFFIATDLDNGSELWVSDGSEAGTHLVKNINPGNGTTDIYSPIVSSAAAGSWLYFTADDGVHGLELWRSDGTSENTTLVTDLAPGTLSSNPNDLTVVEQAGSQAIYFSARDALPGEGHGVELWRVLVTPAGETAEPTLFEIVAGASSSFPKDMRAIGDTVYFSAQDQPGNIELWKAGASPDTLAQVAELVPGTDGSAPEQLAVWNRKLIFSAIDAVSGREPWLSDGTATGTRMIGNTIQGADELGSNPSAGLLTNVGGEHIRYFTARDALHGKELWRTDGTLAGTRMVKDINPGYSSSFMYSTSMAEMGGILYFGAINAESGENLWRTDGTAAGTWMVKDLDPIEFYSYPDQLTTVGNTLYFTAYDALHGEELWSSDGTRDGTNLLKDITPGPQSPYYQALVALTDQLIFVTRGSQDYTYQLWRSDGTPEGTQAFYGPIIMASGFYEDTMSSFYAAGNHLYFNMNTEDENYENSGDRLWMTDGTTSGTVKVKTPNNANLYSPAQLTPAGDTLYFAAKIAPYWTATVWSLPTGSDTTNAASVEIYTDIPRFMGFLNNQKLIVHATDISYGMDQLFTVDTVNQTRQYVCYYGCSPETMQSPTIWSGKLYFIGISSDEETTPSGLWVTDGTRAGTRYLPVPATGLPFKSPSEILSTANGLYFTANDGQHGSEPWIISSEASVKVYLPAIAKGQ